MSAAQISKSRSRLTLALCVVLHTFTHAYSVALVPLYLLMKSDLSLGGVKAAALVVTLYGVVYNLGSYAAGVMADRFDRKLLLGIGLLGNAAAIMGMGFTRDYHVILALGVAAGLFGTLFHPAANALVCDLNPKNPGLAIGLLGVGSGLGFFSGPLYSGWRAEHAAWHWDAISQWQRPCVEMGAAGLLCGLLFLLFAREAAHARHASSPPLGRRLTRVMLAVAALLGWRDFAAVAMISLTSLYLQKACGRTVAQAGFTVGAMMLLGVIANPIAAYLTGGRRRLPALSTVCICAGAIVATTPFWPTSLVLIPLCGFQTFQLGSYAISDASLLERVAPNHRGRIIGLFLSCGGTWAALSPFCIGFWIDQLGPRAAAPSGYIAPFATLAGLMFVAAFSPLAIRRLGSPTGEKPVTLAEEIMPETMEGAI